MKKMDKVIKTIYTILIIMTIISSIMEIIYHIKDCSVFHPCDIYNLHGTGIVHTIYRTFTFGFELLLLLAIPYFLYLIITKKSKKRILLSIIGTIAIIFSHFFISAVTDIHIVAKPMIYIYPEEDNTELVMKLENKDLLTTTYPKYKEGWDIIVNKDGNIYDKNTSRNYYGLYWEGKDNSKINTKEGFVVSGENTTKFLEEKLEILGLNEREINEFIIYWLPKMEHNKYNYIRFRTTEEINQYMPITVNHKIDTLIRVNMDFKPLNKKITIKEQKLTKVERKGFTIVEWGGTEIN